MSDFFVQTSRSFIVIMIFVHCSTFGQKNAGNNSNVVHTMAMIPYRSTTLSQWQQIIAVAGCALFFINSSQHYV
jgi:hypothetical protein